MNIEVGFVDISDPCYNKKVWCRRNSVGVKSGKYNCIKYIKDRINIAVAIIHEDYEKDGINDNYFFSETWIGVDSARAGFFIDYNGEYDTEMTGAYEDAFFEYTPGDGMYPVYYSMNSEGEIVAIKILFVTEKTDENGLDKDMFAGIPDSIELSEGFFD